MKHMSTFSHLTVNDWNSFPSSVELSNSVHSTSLYLIIVLPLLLYTEVFFRVQLLTPYFSPFILSICLPILTHTISYTIHMLMTYNCRCPTDKISELLHTMLSCICDVKAWATANMLKLNDNKTELTLVTFKKN